MNEFQLTASRRGWRLPQMLQWFFHHYFNSQPHEEADFSSASFHPLSYISTHSLTKRLTADQAYKFASTATISTHSLTKRLTWQHIESSHGTWKFQLTASRRGWLLCSPHTSCQIAFQLTASRRGWLWFHIFTYDIQIFQLTASRRGWLRGCHPKL